MSRVLFAVVVLIITDLPPLLAGEPSDRGGDFATEVRPILARNCFPCHGPDEESREADLRLDQRKSAILSAVNESDLENSDLLARIRSSDPDEMMPPPDSGKALTDEQRKLLTEWVLDGANYAQHWAFMDPQKADLPQIRSDPWSRGAIDKFLLSKMSTSNVEPSQEADRHTLIRRLYLDLLGLVPTIWEADAFAKDSRANAYSILVDRLLASPEYGEHWARSWLDLARYSDTNGYEKDRPRSMWPYRDWVIEALNQDMSYDKFTVEQLAGDMLSNPTLSQRVATGFHRNTMLNEEGGIDPLEYRFYAMVDRVATTGTVWMGLTVGCAQCHSHKYDPITHTDYYAMMALLDNTNEPDLFLDKDEYGQGRTGLSEQVSKLEMSAVRRLLADGPLENPDSSFAKWCAQQKQYAAKWTVATPTKFRTNLPKLTRMNDDSVFASGDFTKRDEYFVGLSIPQEDAQEDAQEEPITALRIEALPDDRLPAAGPGRTYYEGRKGQFFLSELKLTDAESQPITIASTSSSNSKKPFELNNTVSDGNGSSGWSNDGDAGVRHTLVAKLKRPVSASEVELQLLFERHFVASLGRFRLSITRDKGDVRALKIAPEAEAVLAQDTTHSSWSQEERELVALEFLRHSAAMAEQRKPIERLRNRLAQRTHTLVMSERAVDNPRTTHRHHRGEYLSPREVVAGRVPLVFSESNSDSNAGERSGERSGESSGEGSDAGDRSPSDRLGFAKWLVSDRNPLFARVVVNRAWRHFMGQGLVRSDGDFGTQASPPTHPQLLDWLAVDFVEQGMSIKNLHRQIVLSAAYRQSSVVRPELRKVDPQNELFARGPRHRVAGETIRDIYLSAGQIMSAKIGGPSVKPPQPASVTAIAWGNSPWDAAQGEDRFRRSLYTFSKRTAPFAAFTTFDGPSGETCIAKRGRSNTPLQALTLLNDQMFIEFAQKLGQAAYDEATTPQARVRNLFRRLLTRPPTEAELGKLLDYYAAQHQRLVAGQLSVEDIAGRADASDDLAALIMVARVTMNLDETITKQ